MTTKYRSPTQPQLLGWASGLPTSSRPPGVCSVAGYWDGVFSVPQPPVIICWRLEVKRCAGFISLTVLWRHSPPGLTLPPLDPRPLPLTLSAAPLFHFPPNNCVTNWACQKTIYHCPTSHPPLPSVPSSSLSFTLSLFPLLSPLQDIPSFFLFVFFPLLMVSCFSLHGHFIFFLPLLFSPHNLISFCLLSYCAVYFCLRLHFSSSVHFLPSSKNLFWSVIWALFVLSSLCLCYRHIHYGMDSHNPNASSTPPQKFINYNVYSTHNNRP